MSKRAKRRNNNKLKSDLEVFLLESGRIFQKTYDETKDVSVLVARSHLERLVESRKLPLEAGVLILNDDEKRKEYLADIEKEYQKEERGALYKILLEVKNNTRTRNALAISVAANALFFILSAAYSHYSSKASPPTNAAPVEHTVKIQENPAITPQSTPSPQPFPDKVEIKNYFFQVPLPPQKRLPVDKTPRCENV